jgi:hypothetical protein
MRTPEEIRKRYVHIAELSDIDKSEIEVAIQIAQTEAWNEAIETAAEKAETKEIKVFYTGARSGGYTTKTVINKESILKLKI